MNILVSGITGFLGSHVAQKLKADGHLVCGVSHTISDAARNIYSFGELASIGDMDAVVHCHAAVSSGNHEVDDETLYNGNVRATGLLVRHFAEGHHIYVSSVAVYGNQAGITNESSDVRPLTAYAISKLWGEHAALRNVRACVVRFPSLYGIGMKERTLIPNYVNQALAGTIEVWGDGSRMQNYLHVTDAAAIIATLVAQRRSGIFLGTAEIGYSNLSVAQMISEFTGASIFLKGDDRSVSLEYDNNLTRKTLNWRPQTQMREAINQYVQWKRKQS